MTYEGLATSNSVPFCLHYTKHPAFVKTRNADAVHTAGQALRGQPLRALRAQLPFQGSHGRCRKAMPPLKGRGGPPLGGGEVRPRRQRCWVAVFGKAMSTVQRVPQPPQQTAYTGSGTRNTVHGRTDGWQEKCAEGCICYDFPFMRSFLIIPSSV